MSTMKFQAPRGTRDFYPKQMAMRNYLVDAWQRVSVRNGFEEVDGPIYESLDLYRVKSGEGNVGAMWALLFTFIGMFLFSLIWSWNYWPPAPSSMTGQPNLEALQLGYTNAATLQEKYGIPAVVFGVGQTLVLLLIYRAILRRERGSKA